MADEFDLDIPDEITLNLSGDIGFKGNIRVTDSPRLSNIISKLRSNKASSEFAVILDSVLREAINASIWTTRNGTDDIIDSGDLLRSGEVRVTNNGVSINYDVPYASLIHYGGYIVPYGNTNAQRVFIPPRPWVSTVLNSGFGGFNPALAYREIIVRILSSI
jgi:phage gpG-like protein